MQSLVQPEDPAGGWQGLAVEQTAVVQSGPAGHVVNSCLVSRLRPSVLLAGVGHKVRQALLLFCCSLQIHNVPACPAVHACRMAFQARC